MASPTQLNACQEAAAQAAFSFLLSPDKEFRISGPAGVGKTFMMQYIMKELLPAYNKACAMLGLEAVNYELALTATTNKATEVLSAATGYPASTIHSFLNLRVQDDFTNGTSKISRTNKWMVHSKTIIFIDEASMVDSALHGHLMAGTDSTCKIIYLGDDKQMAPVFEKISPVYADRTANYAELKTQMRNAGQPALRALCDQLRANVETVSFQPIQAVPGVIDYVDGPAAQAYIDGTFSNENDQARVLCFTNARVNDYNAYIRSLRGYPAMLVPGETVISNAAMDLRKGLMLKVEEEVTIEEITSQPYLQTLDHSGTEISVYDAVIRTRRGETAKVSIPAEPDHFKQVLKFYANQKNWERYFFMKNRFPDLRPRDAATVYKAQGSTYREVFLDLANIGTCTDVNQVARMLYVGASRATTRLVLTGQLPARFFKPQPQALPAFV